MIIIGSGLSGCIAGVLNPEALTLEAGPRRSAHAAVLRFRGPQIGQALGIPFKEVRVFKSVFCRGRHHRWATPAMMNWYSAKVSRGRISERSIGDLSTVQRWVAPDNFHAQMLDRIGGRIQFETPVRAIAKDYIDTGAGISVKRHKRTAAPIISTMPLPSLAALLEPEVKIEAQFRYESIKVQRWCVPDCNVHQTVYFPAPDLDLYRATLTGNTLIAESMQGEYKEDLVAILSDAFGVPRSALLEGTVQSQQYGKIQPIDTELRKKLLWQFTSQFGVFSLGRFALWSNILLDDVFDDLAKIRGMISLMDSGYDLLRSATK